MWKCPKCKSDNLDVEISTWARLEQHGEDDFGTDCDEAQINDHEWDGSSSMQCRDCGHTERSDAFEIEVCRECGEAYEDGGDGYDGLCPSCADKAEVCSECDAELTEEEHTGEPDAKCAKCTEVSNG